MRSSPRWITPFRKGPVVRTTAVASAVFVPPTCAEHAHYETNRHRVSSSCALLRATMVHRLTGVDGPTRYVHVGRCGKMGGGHLRAAGRRPRRLGRFEQRNWRPALSPLSCGPSSRLGRRSSATRWPLPGPRRLAGLQRISPMSRSVLVSSNGRAADRCTKPPSRQIPGTQPGHCRTPMHALTRKVIGGRSY